MKNFIYPAASILALVVSGVATAASCPPATVADPMGVGQGAFPQQYELAEFESIGNCSVTLNGNPQAAALNATIRGNKALPSLSQRIPSEPLVVAPYDSIGSYGGTLDALSNATESGTSDFMSTRHVNLLRYSDDLTTIVPMIAKGWEWNDDFTQLTFFLRKGHKWSDGAPFTAHDVKFWYDNLATDTNVREKPKDYVLVGGEVMNLVVLNPTTIQFNLPSPKPGLLSHFANHYAQGFQPKHFLGQFHPDVNPGADALAKSLGFENGYAVIKSYYGNSDWMDTPSPLLSAPEQVAGMPADTMPTLESHIITRENTEGRHLVANPYYFQIDTAGNQLPYINEQDELYVGEREVRLLKLVNSEVDYKSQSLNLDYAPLLLENQEKGDFTLELRPEIAMSTFSFNVTSDDMEKRKVFGDLRFRQAMSVAMNRAEINEVVYFGLGTPQQYTAFAPSPSFISKETEQSYAQYDPDMANALLDEIGMVDIDGDGMRELPNGDPLVLNMQIATQGGSLKLVEVTGQNWRDVGINNTVKEVTTDEYRSAQSSNSLDVTYYAKGQPLAVILGISELFQPPFDNYFNHTSGMLWGQYVDTNGAEGVKPPQWVYDSMAGINAFQSAIAGSDESNKIGEALVKTVVDNLLFIGTVKAVAPIYRTNKLQNFADFKTQSYAYYRTYPYRASQWWLDE
ncbi:MAG: putative ABC transporter-binding protein [Oceanospirillaceae bacterium UBA2001]|nr:MAG: putative ABC transporter-binding protein [Oceanospirillaceae bacterium UBA2001]